jgi:thiamine-monophosphate kinase
MSDISFIGYMTKEVEDVQLMMKSGNLVKVTSPGYEHF